MNKEKRRIWERAYFSNPEIRARRNANDQKRYANSPELRARKIRAGKLWAKENRERANATNRRNRKSRTVRTRKPLIVKCINCRRKETCTCKDTCKPYFKHYVERVR